MTDLRQAAQQALEFKGWVDVRWLGESNGYYGETVELKCVVPGIVKAEGGAA